MGFRVKELRFSYHNENMYINIYLVVHMVSPIQYLKLSSLIATQLFQHYCCRFRVQGSGVSLILFASLG